MINVHVEFEGIVRDALADHIRKFALETGNVGGLVERLRSYYGEGLESY